MKNVRRKGYLAEREVTHILNQNGIEAYRVPLSGSGVGFKGDVKIILNGLTYTAEVKIRESGFKTIYELLDKYTAIKCDGVVITKLSTFLDCGKEVKPEHCNFSTTSILSWLTGKDLVFFRSNRKEWLVGWLDIQL